MPAVAWSEAMRRANETFYAEHAAEDAFRTSMAAAPAMARALLALIEYVDTALDHPDELDVVDVGCGDGALLNALVALVDMRPPPADQATALATRIRPRGVDLRPRPPTLDPQIAWTQGVAPAVVPPGIVGLVVAHEWLDDLAVDVVGVTGSHQATRRVVDVADLKHRATAAASDDDAVQWTRTWWPSALDPDSQTTHAESGQHRDRAWAQIASAVDAGLLLAIDYGHRRDDRPREATLRGFAGGTPLAPVPDGSMNLTAHVAMDACAAAARAVLSDRGSDGHDALITQKHALSALEQAATSPAGASAPGLQSLVEHGQRAELMDPLALGANLWLLQSVDIALPGGFG